jgi:hypothetical protein
MMTALEILLRTQDREVEVRYFDPQHLVAGDKRSSFSARGANPTYRSLHRRFTWI